MSYQLIELPGITVMGIATRTSNAELNKIGDLWRRFHAMGDHRIVEARLSDLHYGVYCEYEGDLTQPYTMVIGCEVAEGTPPAEDLQVVRVEAGRFAVYKLPYERPNPVFATWEEIWKTPFNRRYQADYDCYGAADGISVHVGVR
jgi:predicted transcriptional regulator YdeE